MFESSVIRGQARVATSRLSLLTISIIAHSAVILGAIAFSIASVEFPTTAPDEFSQAPSLMPLLVPPPLGVREGGLRPQQPPRAAAPPPQRNETTAPAIIPATTIPADSGPAASDTGTAVDDGPGRPGATSTAPFGDPDGTPSGGDPDGVAGMPAVPAVAQRIYEAHEVKAPVGIYRPSPPYPPLLIKNRVPATVVVRCVIDKNGRVRDPEITLPARMAPFNESVLATVKQWRFTPGSLNGEAVETYLSLTVHFSVN